MLNVTKDELLDEHGYKTGGQMKDKLKCPECGSDEVTVSHLQRFMANTGEHYVHAVKTQDADSEATCLECQWLGRRDEMVHNFDVTCGEGGGNDGMATD